MAIEIRIGDEVLKATSFSFSVEATGEAAVKAPVADTAPEITLQLDRLPDDLAEAFEGARLAILSHKLSGWVGVRQDQVFDALDALRQLATNDEGFDG